jgi:hypothetical protein
LPEWKASKSRSAGCGTGAVLISLSHSVPAVFPQFERATL